jgi:hypothetical protein
VISYATNEDVFGVTASGPDNISAWNRGMPGDRLMGRMDRIIRPSEVALFSDGGLEPRAKDRATIFTESQKPYFNAPFLENVSYTYELLPLRRHLEGGVGVALADGAGVMLRALKWTQPKLVYESLPQGYNKYKFVEQYSRRVRVSPYQVGTLNNTFP